MKTPEEIKKLMDYCYQSNPCSECSYNKKDFPECVRRVYRDAYECITHQEKRITELEERINLMLIQMRGDCGCCAYKGRPSYKSPCTECLCSDNRPKWEYEGFPDEKKEEKNEQND